MKAHPDVYKLFLQVMDYGKMTDSKGKVIDFRNTLIIMTSNVGSHGFSHKTMGLNVETEKKMDRAEFEKTFSPEFRARLTGNCEIQFRPLNKEMMLKIVDKYMEDIQTERLTALHIKLKISSEVKNMFATAGLSKNLGARPVKDLIENDVIEPLTDKILFGELKGLKKEKEVLVAFDKNNKIVISVN
jgi:ATP-dependent Clp protease ATP-binding subunit ClpA